MPSMESTQISLTIEAEEGATTDELRSISNEVIERLLTIDDIQTIGAIEGSSGSLLGGSSSSILMDVILDEQKSLSNAELEKLTNEKTSDIKANISISTSNMDMSALGDRGYLLSSKVKRWMIYIKQLKTLKTCLKNRGNNRCDDGTRRE